MRKEIDTNINGVPCLHSAHSLRAAPLGTALNDCDASGEARSCSNDAITDLIDFDILGFEINDPIPPMFNACIRGVT